MNPMIIPKVNNNVLIDIEEIMMNDKIIQIDQFYSSLEWLNNKDLFIKNQINENEEIINLYKEFRIPLLKKVSQLLPTAFYSTDSGWIRTTQNHSTKQPLSTQVHMDSPYLVISVCLSEDDKMNKNLGTEFVYHKELGFKKVTQSKQSNIYSIFYTRHRHQVNYWKVWRQLEFKQNRAYIYSGSLLHRMPKIDHDIYFNKRTMQFFIFRLNTHKLKELNFAI